MKPLFCFSLIFVTCTSSISFVYGEEANYNITSNVSLVSQYLYRGISQTNKKPALQAGVDYAHVNGGYVGLWGSNISWLSDNSSNVSASIEVDIYGGYKKTIEDFSYDFGVLRYQYPGDYPVAYVKPHTTELYGQIGYKFVTLKYSHSLTNLFGIQNSKNSYYLDLTATYPLDEKINLIAHVGRQGYKGNNEGLSNNVYSYTDYKVEGNYAINKEWVLGVGYSDTNARSNFYTNGKNVFLGNNMGYTFIKRNF